MTGTDEIVASNLAAARCTMLNISAPEDMLHEYRGMLGLMEAENMRLEAAQRAGAARRKAEAARLQEESDYYTPPAEMRRLLEDRL